MYFLQLDLILRWHMFVAESTVILLFRFIKKKLSHKTLYTYKTLLIKVEIIFNLFGNLKKDFRKNSCSNYEFVKYVLNQFRFFYRNEATLKTFSI